MSVTRASRGTARPADGRRGLHQAARPADGRRGPRVWTIHVALFVVQVAFASQAVEAKIAMLGRDVGGEGIAPAAVAMFRMLGGALFFQAFARVTGQLARTTLRDHAWLALLSVLGIALNQTLFLVGLRVTTPTSAALLSITIPVMTAALAVAFRIEQPSARTALGLLFAASGVLWLTGVRSVDRGAIVIAINCLSYSAYIVLSRDIIVRLGAVTVITWVFTWGALLFLPVGAAPFVHGIPTWTARGWLFLAYILAMPTILAYLANAWALGKSSASLVTVYVYLQPILAALLAWVQLGHALNARLLVAAAFIAVGVGIVASRRAVPTALTRG